MLETWAFKSQARWAFGVEYILDKRKPLDPTKVKGFLFTYFYDSLTADPRLGLMG